MIRLRAPGRICLLNCLRTGALGAKINGIGFGGTTFALFPGKGDGLKKSIEDAGDEAFIIKLNKGVESY
jgi:mevalonate kinase